MFPKMGSCVRERVWVSLVKEASDTGGIPSPRALTLRTRSSHRVGLGPVAAHVQEKNDDIKALNV